MLNHSRCVHLRGNLTLELQQIEAPATCCQRNVHKCAQKSKKPQQLLDGALEVPWIGLIGALRVPGMRTRGALEVPQRCLVGASNLLERCLTDAIKVPCRWLEGASEVPLRCLEGAFEALDKQEHSIVDLF